MSRAYPDLRPKPPTHQGQRGYTGGRCSQRGGAPLEALGRSTDGASLPIPGYTRCGNAACSGVEPRWKHMGVPRAEPATRVLPTPTWGERGGGGRGGPRPGPVAIASAPPASLLPCDDPPQLVYPLMTKMGNALQWDPSPPFIAQGRERDTMWDIHPGFTLYVQLSLERVHASHAVPPPFSPGFYL
jgi:hypothetical protein